jgi:hypothetical protein
MEEDTTGDEIRDAIVYIRGLKTLAALLIVW